MVSGLIPNASIPMAASDSKDFAKKKRANRAAKLKQCKLHARREQWLSQVKSKGVKEEPNGGRGNPVQSMHAPNEKSLSIKNLEINPRDEENDGSTHHYSDTESSSNSPSSHSGSLLDGRDSGTNFSGSSGSSSSSSSHSSSNGGCCSGDEEDEAGDDGCLDDWETVADAMAATEEEEKQNPDLDLHPGCESPCQLNVLLVSRIDNSKPKPDFAIAANRPSSTCQAWKPDDAFRPQSLPNLSKQRSFPANSDSHYDHGRNVWARKNIISAPSPCPICCEDLDFTDSSFLPCACGFRLCLFCHKRILEEDGRCPGCRKQYNYNPVEGEATVDGGSLTFRLSRSVSMISRC